MISTISPVSGGVPTMTGFIASTLQKGGFEPVLGHYEPYSVRPDLSVPSHKLFQKKPGSEQRTAMAGLETHAFGAWLPELEFTHYRATDAWCQLMDSCQSHLSVSGNILAALPYMQTGRIFLAWVATGWEEDRADRVRGFPVIRRLLDRAINGPVLKKLEKHLLNSGNVLALSSHTRTVLDSIAGRTVTCGVLPMPVDADFFCPDKNAVAHGRIGFTGRFDDPRKNIGLMIEAISLSRSKGVNIEGQLIGGSANAELRDKVSCLGLDHCVSYASYLPRQELRAMLQALDVFVLPSFQEGLCISALEAMACGVPVVSTRCGGPEEFVINDETGYLVGFDAGEMAAAIDRIVSDRNLRARLGANARQLIIERYNSTRCEEIFWRNFVSNSPIKQEVAA